MWTAASRCHTGSWEARQAPNAKLLREQRWLLVVHSCIGQRGLWETSETLESILIESRTLIETDGVRAGSGLRQGQISSVLSYLGGTGIYGSCATETKNQLVVWILQCFLKTRFWTPRTVNRPSKPAVPHTSRRKKNNGSSCLHFVRPVLHCILPQFVVHFQWH